MHLEVASIIFLQSLMRYKIYKGIKINRRESFTFNLLLLFYKKNYYLLSLLKNYSYGFEPDLTQILRRCSTVTSNSMPLIREIINDWSKKDG